MVKETMTLGVLDSRTEPLCVEQVSIVLQDTVHLTVCCDSVLLQSLSVRQPYKPVTVRTTHLLLKTNQDYADSMNRYIYMGARRCR